MARVLAVAVFFLCPFLIAQPMSQKESCQKFSSAVVRIDTGRDSHGTGFIIAQDGWILTAAHVVIDPRNGQSDAAITVTLPDGSIEFAKQVLLVDENVVGKDFALLRLEKTHGKLPALELGSEAGIATGSEVTIIGFPFSAIGRTGEPITKKFCLAGIVSASGMEKVSFSTRTGVRDVDVSVIYFQGPSVKGLSGSPVISRDTGTVIGILTTRLTGINSSLDQQRQGLEHPSINMRGGFDLVQTLRDLINVLDTQLANGLGAASGIDDAAFAAKIAQRHYKGGKNNQ